MIIVIPLFLAYLAGVLFGWTGLFLIVVLGGGMLWLRSKGATHQRT